MLEALNGFWVSVVKVSTGVLWVTARTLAIPIRPQHWSLAPAAPNKPSIPIRALCVWANCVVGELRRGRIASWANCVVGEFQKCKFRRGRIASWANCVMGQLLMGKLLVGELRHDQLLIDESHHPPHGVVALTPSAQQ